MFDDLNSLQHLAHFDVDLTGDWSVSASGQRQWNGEAIAQTTIVGITFLMCGNRMYWAKSGKPYAPVAPQVRESQRLSNKLFIELRLQGPLKVQFICSIGLRDRIDRASAVFTAAVG